MEPYKYRKTIYRRGYIHTTSSAIARVRPDCGSVAVAHRGISSDRSDSAVSAYTSAATAAFR
jgi:hypothetical protein